MSYFESNKIVVEDKPDTAFAVFDEDMHAYFRPVTAWPAADAVADVDVPQLVEAPPQQVMPALEPRRSRHPPYSPEPASAEAVEDEPDKDDCDMLDLACSTKPVVPEPQPEPCPEPAPPVAQRESEALPESTPGVNMAPAAPDSPTWSESSYTASPETSSLLQNVRKMVSRFGELFRPAVSKKSL
jgi:hypothetical protein